LPAQAAFTNPELRELGELSEADVVVDPSELERGLAVPDPSLKDNAIARQNVEILRRYSERAVAGKPRRIAMRFLLSPVRLIPDEAGRVGAVELVRNELVPDEKGTLRARPTAARETIDAGLVFRAIGYRGLPLPGVPFDERQGVIPNDGGRVTDPSTGVTRPGEYVVGWIKRGPTGVIGTNKRDAQQTVDAILADLAERRNGSGGELSPDSPDAASVERLLIARKPDLVPYDGWLEIDRHERVHGERQGRPRVKLTRIDEMLRIAAAESPDPEE